MSKNVEAIIKLISERYDPTANGQGYWDGGNFDDTFHQGEESGYNDALLEIGRMLDMDLPDKDQLEY